MKQYNSVEEYAAHVRSVSSSVLASMCRHMGPEHPAVQRMADLCTEAAAIVQQNRMQQERAGGNYDLSTLHVRADTPSNSETPFEDE